MSVFLYSIKLGVMEDHSNRTRLAKLLRFYSSNSEKEMTSLADYVERMKEKQEAIYFMAGTSRKEVRFGWKIELTSHRKTISVLSIRVLFCFP